MTFISSASNPKFQHWKKLLTRSGWRRKQEFIVSGRKIVPEVLKNSKLPLRALLRFPHGPDLTKPPFLEAYELSADLFRQLDCLGTHFPLLVMQAPQWPDSNLNQPATQGLEILCGLGDPQNVGALIRSAVAFQTSQNSQAPHIILLKESAHPFHPRSIKASAGAVFKVNFSYGPSLQDLPPQTPGLVVLDLEGQEINKFCWPQHVRLLMGEEGLGLPPTLRDNFPMTPSTCDSSQKIRIPISQEVESLNAVVAASLAFYSYQQNFKSSDSNQE